MRTVGEGRRGRPPKARDGGYATTRESSEFKYALAPPRLSMEYPAQMELASKGYRKVDNPEDHGYYLPPDGTVLMAKPMREWLEEQDAIIAEHNQFSPNASSPSFGEMEGKTTRRDALSLDDLKNSQLEGPAPEDIEV